MTKRAPAPVLACLRAMSEPWSIEALDSPAPVVDDAPASLARSGLRSVAAVDRDHAVPERPSNLRRSLFHVTSALVSLLFTLVVFDSRQLAFVAGSIAITFWCLEALRRPFPRFNALLMRFFAPIAHPKEREEVNSATWYMTALTLLALTQSPVLCAIGVAVLGFGDPVASAIGRKIGRVHLMNGRTLEGSLAFVVAATLTAIPAAALASAHLPIAVLAVASFAAALAGAVAEILSRRMDDNFTIPLAAMGAATVVLAVFGHTPWG